MKKNLFLAIFFCFFISSVFAQQSICFGTIKNYSVDLVDGVTGTTGSVYAWSVTEPTFSGTISGNPSLSGNSVTINWSTTPVGTYTIKVIETNNGCVGLPVTLSVIINALPTISGTLSACAGSTTQLSGSASPNATTPWVSSNTAVATISSTGLVTGISAGTTNVTYTNSNGCTKTEVVTIYALPTITGTLSACAGSTTQLTGSGISNATTPWVSSNTAVATISSTGLVTGLSAGTTTITYTNSNGCIKTEVVTINALPTITGTLSVCSGSTTQLTGSGTPSATTPWVSSNTVVATISNIGLVTGVSSGIATITYTNSNGCVKTVSVTINATPITSSINFN